MYSGNIISQPYFYVSPQKTTAYRPNRFQYNTPSPPKNNVKTSNLPDNFQEKLNYLNEKLDQQLKLSAEIGAKATKQYIYPNNIAKTNQDIRLTASYTPDRFITSKNLNNFRDNYYFNTNPAIQTRIIEDSINNQKNEYVKKSQEIKESPHGYHNNNDIGLLEKIHIIQENLGIDVEALLDRIYEVSEASPHNPLKKLEEKKRSRVTTPEKAAHSSTPSKYVETEKKTTNTENSFQTTHKPFEIKSFDSPSVIKNSGKEKEFVRKSIKEEFLKERESIKKHENEKKSKEYIEKERLINELNEKKIKEKNRKAEIRMDVKDGLEGLYAKVMEEVKEKEESLAKVIEIEEKDIEDYEEEKEIEREEEIDCELFQNDEELVEKNDEDEKREIDEELIENNEEIIENHINEDELNVEGIVQSELGELYSKIVKKPRF